MSFLDFESSISSTQSMRNTILSVQELLPRTLRVGFVYFELTKAPPMALKLI